MFSNKTILVTGGTGSLGKVLIRRLLSGEMGTPKKIIVLSRDEAKQHEMRISYLNSKAPTDEVIYNNFRRLLEFRIGDVRDFHSVSAALQGVDFVFNAAALKQVPSCEYFPFEAVRTNIEGPENIVRMTKAIQERVFITANLDCPGTRYICVRYGNVLASRGSVIPLFHEQIRAGGPVTITTADMTRFLLSLDQAVDTIFAAIKGALRGETYIPRVPSAKVTDIAKTLIGNRPVKTVITGIRPGEKIHEILVSEEEANRTITRGDYYVIRPILPEIAGGDKQGPVLGVEFSSSDNVMTRSDLAKTLKKYDLMIKDTAMTDGELLR
jgi:FlaA1/EpsC-like NDP-sugar epimerase